MEQRCKLRVEINYGKVIEVTQVVSVNDREDIKNLCRGVIGGEFDYLTLDNLDTGEEWVLVRASDIRMISLVLLEEEDSNAR